MPFTILTGGSFTSTGVGVKIPLPSSADYFKTWNVTQLATTQNPGRCVMGEWFGSKFGAGQSAANDGIRWTKTNSSSALNATAFSTATASSGFTYIVTSPTVEAQAANAITAITAASPAVVSQTNTYTEGDIIRIYGTTGMLQIAGMDFQISSVSGSGYTLLGLPAAGFAAAATAGFTRRISKFAAVEPQTMYVTAISKAASAVVTTSIDPSFYYVVGQKITFSVPPSFGMTEINGLTGTITAVNSSTYQVTVDINSTNFTTFAFPASTASPNAQLFATYAPAGQKTAFDPVTLVQTGYNFNLAPFHTGEFTPSMFLAAGAQSPAGSASDVINWMAYKLEN